MILTCPGRERGLPDRDAIFARRTCAYGGNEWNADRYDGD